MDAKQSNANELDDMGSDGRDINANHLLGGNETVRAFALLSHSCLLNSACVKLSINVHWWFFGGSISFTGRFP